MKKATSILAVTVLALGMFSCEPESTAQETDALYGAVNDNPAPTQATDREELPIDERD
ncbi:hypothetical protein K8352_09990 [Flavobacteriaceae bacterium F89]|uniref:Uncharacterized protein n=1 Tax=Cerina litoralis TaxID=2874477 RepID=A0AAE3EWN4_9FLAO|nr:hypothetical protein [Cerina litoralis]MCG2461077.1 hypothetical protein [Cerina litoralis]